MEVKKTASIAGMSLGGGKKENFFFCFLEYFEKEKRWFLTSLKQVKEESNISKDEAITSWVEKSDIKQLVVDFPQSRPACETCDLKCPGEASCHHPTVATIRGEIKKLLQEDSKREKENPKKYEQERELDNQVHHSKSVLEKETSSHILSKSFKRKLKKGYMPYWNRPIDFWVWKKYYDQLLKLYDISYDSFGTVSVMLLYKFHYLLKHLPDDLKIFESSTQIILIELYRAKIVSKKQIMELQDINVNTLARVQVAHAIEKHLNLFIYKKDLELISQNPKAFDSFLLAISGHSLISKKIREIETFEAKEDSKFISPIFE